MRFPVPSRPPSSSSRTSASLLLLLLLLHAVPLASALPQSVHPSSSSPSISLRRRRPLHRDAAWARKQIDTVVAKYGGPDTADTSAGTTQKRATSGANQIVNQNTDSSYFGSLAVGTPPVSFNVILDTGSSDMWLAGSACKTACEQVPTYDPAQSSTFKNRSTPFHITYGSGAADGSLGADVVQMAGFQVPNQIFAVCNSVTAGLLNNPVSGLLGLAFESLASSKATPFWQSLVQGNALSEPLFSFFLSRFIDIPVAANEEPGGEFLMGATNSSLYTGDIDFVNVPPGEQSYWILPVTSLSVQGNAVSLPTGSGSLAAIDTGTTLIGGPPDVIASMFAQIPGSKRGTGDYKSYWTYPCNTKVKVAISFGGRTWKINPADFKLASVSRDTCVGAFFELQMGSTAPAWIIGDTFLKNVYSVFRFSPPSVGFAQLSTTAESFRAAGGPLPTPTIGVNPAMPTNAAAAAMRPSLLSCRRGGGWSSSWCLSWIALLASFGAVL